jgi:two-component system, cell cycle sensor histidine kinase and response regulator CckA
VPDPFVRRGVLDAVADPALICSVDLRITAINAPASAALGLPADDVQGRSLLDFVSEEDAGRLGNALTQTTGTSEGHVALQIRLLAPGREPWLTEVRIAALGHRRTDGYLITAAASAVGHPGLNSLRRIAETRRREHGGEFLPFLARHAAESLGVRHVLIGRFEGNPPERISTVAVWSDGKAVPNFTYDLAGTPCSDALQRRICHFAEGVRDRYPENMLLRELGVESYTGASILDADHQPVGVLAVLDDRPRYHQEDLFSAVYLLSVRAGAELERERIAGEMRETEERWLELARGTSDGLFDIDFATGATYLSPRCLQLLGHEPQEQQLIRVPDLFECVHPDDRGQLNAELKRVRRGGNQLHCTLRLRRRGGDHRWFEARARLTRDAAGAPARALGFISDVTESQRRSRMLRQISEVARVAAWTYDIETDQFISLTDSLRAIGVSDEEVASILREPERFLGPEDASRARAAILQAKAEGAGWDFVYSRRVDSGATVWRRTFAEVEMERGVAVRIHGAVQDITSLHDLEAKYLQAQKMEAIGLLAGGIAHDFNNLLTVISGLRELVTDSVAEDHPCQDDLTQMDLVIQSASSLTQQLLALARRQVVEPVSLSLNDLVEEVRPLLARLLGDRVGTECALGQGLWPVLADRSKLEQVLLNFAVNAKDAMPNGGRLSFRTRNAVFSAPQPTVHGERPAGAFVELQVQDTGVGMDPHTLARIFEPFFTTKQLGRGTGLGLATCLGVIQQAGGYIAVESAPGEGTTFSIWLPPANRPPDPARSKEATILLAEDDPVVGNVTARILRRRGYQVLPADSVESAIQIATTHPGRIDLLLCGAKPTGMSCEAARAALALTRPDIRVLIVGGEVTVHDAASLRKPYTSDELLAKVSEVLGRPA